MSPSALTPPSLPASPDDLLAGLNEPQRAAVTHSSGPLLILAGAGSGKTRALIHKLAWLIQVERVAPWQILAVTFTNKAAGELRERAAKLLGEATAADLWLGTFHSIGVRILRQHGHNLGLSKHFVIHDADDTETMLKRVMRQLDIDEKAVPPKQVRAYIEEQKRLTRGPTSPDLPTHDLHAKRFARIYAAYEPAMRAAQAVDFSDLIYLPYRLATEFPHVGLELRLRFRHILVDEFQDTNRAQFLLLKSILGDHHNLCVVGDDDQSIYRWRGALVENILHFDREFPDTAVIRFEQNYRSTHPILAVSSALIAQNRGRHGKTLFTTRTGGEQVRLFRAETDVDEAAYVVRRITALRTRYALSQCAIIYRTNAQSRLFEDRLRLATIPYKVYGGLRFYDRAEVKDVIAYLRVLVNPADPIALQRAINRPNRGIGDTTIARLEARPEATLWESLCAEAREGSGAPAKRLAAFVELIVDLQAQLATATALEITRQVLDSTGYLTWLTRDGSVEGETRAETVRELLNGLGEYCDQRADPSLAAWLDEVALLTNLEERPDHDAVVLMTAHMAKGLEFDVVFVTGLEDGLMPHSNSQGEPAALEEERRLAYVAMTRARHLLHLTYAESRRKYGILQYSDRSPFLAELPEEHLLDENPRPAARHTPSPSPSLLVWSRRPAAAPARQATPSFDAPPTYENESQLPAPTPQATPSTLGWAPGSPCFHPSFGQGVVLRVEGAEARVKLRIRFWDHSERTLLATVVSEL